MSDTIAEAAAPTTVPVKVTLVGMERLTGHGALAALLDIELEVGDFCLPIHGVQIIRPRNGSRLFVIQPPRYRGSNGTWREAIELPDVVLRAVIQQLTEHFTAEMGVPAV